ncbi:hypothetical protein P5705_08395 [Pseudomonas entomophila]|uniref:hypothetical protein n=1 Tax=Pseudomonas entomophila TaxID=312306 RepID=UPI0024057057|nr:hypothetical protein [Pseudomonas entomophila]MDF9617658.1 hypothetical protein [Pseudomonas entomophila]
MHNRIEGMTAGIVMSILFLAGCSTTPYKQDIQDFDASIKETARAITAQQKRVNDTLYTHWIEERATATTPFTIPSDCTGGATLGQLNQDRACLLAWSASREQHPASSVMPATCQNASAQVKDGQPRIYSIDELKAKETKHCQLGMLINGKLHYSEAQPAPLDDGQLLAGLQAYSNALVGIVDATDKEALQKSFDKSKAQIEQLAKSIDERDGKTSARTAVAGPVVTLGQSLLTALLEARRTEALKKVTAAADGVVTQAAVELSNIGAYMTQLELKFAADALFAHPPGQPTNDAKAWQLQYENTRAVRDNYLARFDNNPGAALKAMADAHHALANALADPSTQYESVQAAIANFAEKAQAIRSARDAAEKAKAAAS